MSLGFLQKIFQISCSSLIDINVRSTQKIRKQIRKNLCCTYQISNIHGTGISTTRPLNINHECESMSAKNVHVADSPDSANTFLKNLRLAKC